MSCNVALAAFWMLFMLIIVLGMLSSYNKSSGRDTPPEEFGDRGIDGRLIANENQESSPSEPVNAT